MAVVISKKVEIKLSKLVKGNSSEDVEVSEETLAQLEAIADELFPGYVVEVFTSPVDPVEAIGPSKK